uniref:Uncharacterized protein n=1 Tax=Nomascus leucogenys TaxID=61853 RepID=A0A2I3GEL3_NOMLE
MTIFRDPVSVTETFFVGDYSSHLQQLPLLINWSAGIFRPHCLGTNRGRRQVTAPRRLHPAQLEVLY